MVITVHTRVGGNTSKYKQVHLITVLVPLQGEAAFVHEAPIGLADVLHHRVRHAVQAERVPHEAQAVGHHRDEVVVASSTRQGNTSTTTKKRASGAHHQRGQQQQSGITEKQSTQYVGVYNIPCLCINASWADQETHMKVSAGHTFRTTNIIR